MPVHEYKNKQNHIKEPKSSLYKNYPKGYIVSVEDRKESILIKPLTNKSKSYGPVERERKVRERQRKVRERHRTAPHSEAPRTAQHKRERK